MFGYFRPFGSKLSVGERRLFHTYYCRLCYCLRNVGGQKMRALTTFDMAIYSMIYAIAKGDPRPPLFSCEKIRKNNMNKFKDDKVGLRFADMTLVAFGEKLRDDIIDGNKKRAFLVKTIYGKQIKQAQTRQPELTEISTRGIDKINDLQDGGANANAVLKAYGDMTAETFKQIGVDDQRFLSVYKGLAMWTFFVDMLVDYKDDYKQGVYNAFMDKDCKTIEEVFTKDPQEILDLNKKISNDIIDSLKSIDNGSKEWTVVYRIVEHALNTVVFDILEGRDVKFHYFKELNKNRKLSKGEYEDNFS